MELLDDAENSGWILRWIREVSGVQISHQKWCWYWGQGKVPETWPCGAVPRHGDG